MNYPSNRYVSQQEEPLAIEVGESTSKKEVAKQKLLPTIILVHIGAAFFYGSISTLVTILNKHLISGWKFENINFLLLIQNLATILVLYFLKALKLIQLSTFDPQIAKRMFPLAVCYTFNVLIALQSLVSLEIPMYGVLKRLTTIFTLLLERIVLGKEPSQQLVLSILLMVYATRKDYMQACFFN